MTLPQIPEIVTQENDYERWVKLMSQWRHESKPATLVTQRATYRVHVDADTNLPVFTRDVTDHYASRSI